MFSFQNVAIMKLIKYMQISVGTKRNEHMKGAFPFDITIEAHSYIFKLFTGCHCIKESYHWFLIVLKISYQAFFLLQKNQVIPHSHECIV